MADSFTYDGGANISATFDSVAGHNYRMVSDDPDSSVPSAVASGSTLTLNITDAGGPAGTHFAIRVDDLTAQTYVATTMAEIGQTSDQDLATSWSYDGAHAVSATFASVPGVTYQLDAFQGDFTSVGSASTVAAGTSTVLNLTISTPSGGLNSLLFDLTPSSGGDIDTSNRLGTYGSPGVTYTPFSAGPVSANEGIRFAPTSATFDTSPLFVRLDDPNWPAVPTNSKVIQKWETHRGRQYELDKTQAGTAVCTAMDSTGRLDPTNPAGPYFGNIGPLRQFKVNVQNPVDDSYHDIFTGFVESWDYAFADQSANLMVVTINATDGFELLTRAEVVPDSTGTTVFTGAKVDAWLNAALDAAGWPPLWRNVFSGNVDMQNAIYNPQATYLSILQDGADAELPNAANIFMDKFGNVAFRGRWARFYPQNYESDPPTPSHPIRVWNVGDGPAARTFGYAPIFDIEWKLDLKNVINACLCYPNGIAQSAIAGQLKINAASIGKYGTRLLSIPDIYVLDSVPGPGFLPPGGDGVGKPSANANDECQIIGQYYVDNYNEPVEMISSITFQTIDPETPVLGPAWWKFVTGVEIGDIVIVTVANPGGGGFKRVQFFVEGIHNVVVIGDTNVPQWTMNLDLSPRAWYRKFDGVTYFVP